MAQFKDFNFKLLVIEQLMYTDETLTPPFHLVDLLRQKGLGNDAYDYAQRHGLAYKVVPEARDHFASLHLDDDLLAGVEELCMDGGLQVYQECAPIWDGEDDLFDVASLDDLALLPNLRRVIGSEFLSPELQDVLTARGIAAD
ncbi:DUF6892 domain-containing protein [Streptomyces fragilis]|uniref:DUF6892 domain-containing protein n=1 Tax=Streptomyces fragilis TaxID=67301 RepID=A0ABV2YAE6_9ACTN|nr:hypothetical protein [Streptomyces fragilis]